VQPSCEAIVDVAFILDSSGSLRREYQKEKNFLKTLAAMFGISSNGSRAGVVTFSFIAQHSIKLNSFNDLDSFNKAVDDIPLMGSTTRIDRALRLTQRQMFTVENGGRVGVTKLIILLTDGSQTPGGDAEDPDVIADELRNDGFVIIGIGIGSEVNQTELSHISGSKANTYSAATFDSLKDNDFIHKIKNSSCEIGNSIVINYKSVYTNNISTYMYGHLRFHRFIY
jgi:secreted protein with Ig-like and vWFA domain